MNRSTVVVIGVLVVLATVLAGSLLGTLETPDDAGGGQQSDRTGAGGGAGPGFSGIAVPQWISTVAILLAVVLVIGVVLLNRGLAANYLGATVVLVAIAMLIWLLIDSFQGPQSLINTTAGNRTPPAANSTGAGSKDGGNAVSTQFGLIGLVVIVGASILAVAYLSTRGVDELADESDEEPDEEPPAEVSRAAGRAADRIETNAGDTDNEVFRAWVEMTRALDVDHPRSSTPGEFADVATRAGFDREVVAELTDLFREVRYGEATPDTDREQAAVELLRRIEQQANDSERVDDE